MLPQVIPNLTIRLFGTGDSIRALTELLHEAYRALAERGMHFVASHQDEQTTSRRIEGRECWLALIGDQLVGTITLSAPGQGKGTAWYERPDVAKFNQFAVFPSWQGRGIGSALLAQVECRARQKGASELALDTAEPAQDLHRFYSPWIPLRRECDVGERELPQRYS